MIDSALMEAMADPAFYPHRPESVELRQTHISVLALAGPLVYKIKKPVDFGFCDFTTLEKRLFYCKEEIRLNRRLAPDVYRRVAPIVRLRNGGFALDGHGETLEYAVEMRRLPEERMLPTLLAAGKVTVEDAAALAQFIHQFHQKAGRSDSINIHGRLQEIEAEVRRNFQQLKPFVGRTIEEGELSTLRDRTERFLTTHHDLFSQRVADGRIVEGHGDLHADHICLEPSGIVIYDCIEFNEAFRCLDIASEVAFLTMDLDYLGHPDIADVFALHYRTLAEDPGLPRMLPFYQSYRAVVRGKVESFRLEDPDVPAPARSKAAEAARQYLALALLYAQSFDLPALIIFCGIIGSGKTSLAKSLASNIEGVAISSDLIRKELAGLPAEVHRFEAFGSGLYSQEMTEHTYAALLERARTLLAAGRTVILDASFSKRTLRDQARRLAAEAEVEAWCCWCRCDEENLRRRLRDRMVEEKGPSDAREGLMVPFTAAFEPPDEWPEETLAVVDTTRSLASSTAALVEKLRPRPSTTLSSGRKRNLNCMAGLP
jgi:aminoglycoside phosphotransferase family enzyme/predicted kinase